MKVITASFALCLPIFIGCTDSISPTTITAIRIDPRYYNTLIFPGAGGQLAVFATRADGSTAMVNISDVQLTAKDTSVAQVSSIGWLAPRRAGATFVRASLSQASRPTLVDSIPVAVANPLMDRE
jgi:hypothetical protein